MYRDIFMGWANDDPSDLIVENTNFDPESVYMGASTSEEFLSATWDLVVKVTHLGSGVENAVVRVWDDLDVILVKTSTAPSGFTAPHVLPFA